MRKLMLLIVLLMGCQHKTETNPVVIQAVTLANAEKVVNTVAHGVLAADGVLDQIQAQEPDYYKAVEPKLKAIAGLNESANQCIVTAVKGGSCDWKLAVIALAKGAGQPSSLTAFGFKNPSSQQKVEVGLAGLIAGLNMAIQFEQAGGQ